MDLSRGISTPHLPNGKMTIGTEIEREIEITEEIGINTINQTTVLIKEITTATVAAVIILKREGRKTECKRDRRARVLGSEPRSL
jgi:hypothetical protein